MQHFDLLPRIVRIIAVTALTVGLISGCATAPPNSLQQIKLSMTSKLTADCFWKHEGERYVFGAAPVWSACRRWATTAVNGQFRNSAGNHRRGE